MFVQVSPGLHGLSPEHSFMSKGKTELVSPVISIQIINTEVSTYCVANTVKGCIMHFIYLLRCLLS